MPFLDTFLKNREHNRAIEIAYKIAPQIAPYIESLKKSYKLNKIIEGAKYAQETSRTERPRDFHAHSKKNS